MPRPKPTYEELRDECFSDVLHIVPSHLEREQINSNFNFTFLCFNDLFDSKGQIAFNREELEKDSVKHEYKLNVNYIKHQGKDPHTCPYCIKEKKELQNGISYKILENYVNDYGFDIVNKKEFYNRDKDTLIVKCRKDKHLLEIKSLLYREKNGFKSEIICEKCVEREEKEKLRKFKEERGLIDNDKFDSEIEKVIAKISIGEFKLPEPIYNKEITANSIRILKDKWHIKEYNGTRNKSVFICKDCGKEKIAYIGALKGKGFSCLNCFYLNQKSSVSDKLKDICKNYEIIPNEEFKYISVSTSFDLKCNKCGHIFSDTWSGITGKYYVVNCPNCYVSRKTLSEEEFASYIRDNYKKEIIQNTKKIITPYELDVYLPSERLAFEYCGIFWHSEANGKTKYYHQHKYTECKKHGIRLITIFEDEWIDKKNICQSRIKNILGFCDDSVGARECKLEEVDKQLSNKFLEDNHIQGMGRGDYDMNVGLKYNDELVSLMSFKLGETWELSRYCSKINLRIIGGANKILNYFRTLHRGKELTTFSDLRWTEGKIYENLGFAFKQENPPSCSYVGSKTSWKRVHRITMNKQYLEKKFGCDSSKKKDELTEELGLYKIWDCGKKKFSMIC